MLLYYIEFVIYLFRWDYKFTPPLGFCKFRSHFLIKIILIYHN